MTITKEERARLRELEAKATPGDWTGDRHDGTVKYSILSATGGVVTIGRWDDDGSFLGFQTDEDAALVIRSRNALIPLLDEIDRLEQRVEELQRFIAWYNRG